MFLCSAGAGGVLVPHPGEAAQVLPPVHQQPGAQEVRHLSHLPRHQPRQGGQSPNIFVDMLWNLMESYGILWNLPFFHLFNCGHSRRPKMPLFP